MTEMGKFSLGLKGERLGSGDVGVVHKQPVGVRYGERIRYKNMAVKEFATVDDANRAIENYTRAKERDLGERMIPTYRLIDETHIAMTDLNSNGLAVHEFSRDEDNVPHHEFFESIEGFESLFEELVAYTTKAAEKDIALPYDAWFIQLPIEKGNEGKISVLVGDFDIVQEDMQNHYKTPELKKAFLVAQNIENLIEVFRGLVQETVKSGPTYDTYMSLLEAESEASSQELTKAMETAFAN